MCVWVTYPWTCWIWDSCRSATWTSSAPCRSPWRPRDPFLPSDRSRSTVPMLPLPLFQVPPSLPSVPPSLPSVPPSLSSLVTPIGCWWQACWWSLGAPGDAPSSSWYRYFYSEKGGGGEERKPGFQVRKINEKMHIRRRKNARGYRLDRWLGRWDIGSRA